MKKMCEYVPGTIREIVFMMAEFKVFKEDARSISSFYFFKAL
jgi:hypothetical protein